MADPIRDWFPFFPGDWLSDVDLRLCPLEARGLLVDLMALSWQEGTPGEINRPVADLARYLQAPEGQVAAMLDVLLDRRRVHKVGNRIVIKRLVEIGKEQMEKHLRRVNAGGKGGRGHKRQETGLQAHDDPGNTDISPDESCEPGEAEGPPIGGKSVNWVNLIAWWNELAVKYGCKKLVSMNTERRRKLRSRLVEVPNLKQIVEKELPLMEPEMRSAGWFGFPWLIHSSENLTKFLEGSYRSASAVRAERSRDKKAPVRDGFTIRVRYSDNRPPEDYHILNDKELSEMIEAHGLVPILDDDGNHFGIAGAMEYEKDVTGPDRRLVEGGR